MKCRPLLIAESCNPERVGVPLEGWSHARAIAELVDAHLVTQMHNRDAIRRHGLREGHDFTALDAAAVVAPLQQFGRWLHGSDEAGWLARLAIRALGHPYLQTLSFEHQVWEQFGRRIRDGGFDVVHRLTQRSPTMPSLLAERCARAGVPFVLGPLNGGVPWPREFGRVHRQEKERPSETVGAYRLLPGYQSGRRHAAAILVGSRETWRQMARQYRGRYFYVPEYGIDPRRFHRRRTRRATRPIKAIFAGRIVPYKGADLLLEAAAGLIRSGELTVEILGDGPQMPLLHEIARREALGRGLSMPGWIPQPQVQDRLVEADLFTFPGIREAGGAGVLEAMAVGLAPVVMDYGGPGELVTDRTGWRVPNGAREEIIRRFRIVLEEVVRRPKLIDQKSQAAMCRAREQFSWKVKASQVLQVYDWVLKPGSLRPVFEMPTPDLPDAPSNERISA
jgi:glycosyltransferase involved in cell wall biosynthesis